MIDGIGGRLPPDTAHGTPATGAARGAPARPVPVARQAAPGVSTQPRDTGTPPPVDTAKINRIRAAIADGSYPVDPERIASAMIARDRTRH